MRLTDFLAIYGAGVSTTTAVWNYLRTKAQVRVILIYALDTHEGESQVGLGISVQNVSGQPVHLTNISFLYPFRRMTFRRRVESLIQFKRVIRNEGWCHSSLSLHGISDGCPVSIEPGKSHWVFVRQEMLGRFLEEAQQARLKAVVLDALWRRTYSKSFDCSTFLKSKQNG